MSTESEFHANGVDASAYQILSEKMAPVHFFSHGSTMMLGEECESASYWEKCGNEALANGVKGLIIMVRFFVTAFCQPTHH